MTADSVTLTLPPELLEQVAERAAELLAERERAPEPWITVGQAAEHLGCGTSRIYSLVSARRIPFAKDGSRVIFKRSELDRWVEQGGASCPG